VIAAVGGGLNFIKSTRRPFSLLDLSISFPFVPESISTTILALVALVAPAVIITIVCALFIPGSGAQRSLTRKQTIRRKLWEVYAGLTGLALSVALAFFVTQGLKNIFGKPRPHLIALCKPDLTNIAKHVVGGEGQDISIRWTLVNSSICTQSDNLMLADGFRSFPSGHSSFSWSGLLYLSLWLCSKFSITVPYLPLHSARPGSADSRQPADIELLPLHHPVTTTGDTNDKSFDRPVQNRESMQSMPLYNQAASPPTYGLLLVLIPLGVATYITSTRYHEFWHFGFDVLSGSLIGILSAWLAFRWYHLPLNRGQGWAWGPRTRDRAFGIGVGIGNYAGPEGWESGRSAK